MNISSNPAYSVNFRYWIAGKLFQVQHDDDDYRMVLAKVEAGEASCKASGYDYLLEIFPRFKSPVVSGSKFGLAHHRDLL